MDKKAYISSHKTSNHEPQIALHKDSFMRIENYTMNKET